MRISNVFLPCVLGIALSSAASAEIYESKDAQGNTVFSDRPSQGAEEIKVPPTNSADPVQEIPGLEPTAETAPAPKKVSTRRDREELQDADDDYYYYGGIDDNDDADNRRDRRQREDGVGREDPPHVEHHRNDRNVARPAGNRGRR